MYTYICPGHIFFGFKNILQINCSGKQRDKLTS